MKSQIFESMVVTLLASVAISSVAISQEAIVDVKLSPAGSFKVKSTEVKGSAELKGSTVEAKGLAVSLKNVTTGITLRDEHTKKHLEVDKYPEAVLVSATGKDGKGEGVVKIHGVERSVKGTYEINNDKLTANFPLKLSEFGIEGIKYMGVGVQDEVQLTVTVPVQVASAAGAIEATPKATTGAAGSAAKKESKAK